MAEKVVIFNFSPRDNGNCEKVSKLLGEYFVKHGAAQYRITEDSISPCGNCNYQCLTPNVVCPNRIGTIVDAMDAACSADVVYFVIPNICGWPCANFFAFNERSIGYFNMDRELMAKYQSVAKGFIVISNTEGSNFSQPLKSQTKDEPKILYLKTGKYHKRSTAGDLMDDPAARAELADFLAETSPFAIV